MKKAVTTAAIVLSLTALLLLQGGRKPASVPAPKIILIGIDGAGWDLMNHSLRERKLPHFSKLIETGTTASLKSIAPAHPPALWTSIATGKVLSRHGIHQYTVTTNGRKRPVSGADRKAAAFWNILSRNGIRTGVLNWWVSWPPEEMDGFIVSDRNSVFESPVPATFPPDLALELPRISLDEEQFAAEMRSFGLSEYVRPAYASRFHDEFAERYRHYWNQERELAEMTQYLLLNRPVEVLAVTFRIAHLSSHLFWSNMEPGIPQQIRARLRRGRTIPEDEMQKIQADLSRRMSPVFIYLDEVLGSLLHYADQNTVVIVCSGHGFHFQEGMNWHTDLRSTADGILIVKGPPIRQDHQLTDASIMDITPTLLYLAGLPSAGDMDGKTLTDAIAPAYLQLHPPGIIDTHETDKATSDVSASGEMDSYILEEWRALRYIR